MNIINVAVVDDHRMISKAIEDMISSHDGYKVIMNCSNGDEFITALESSGQTPDVVLMDINMPFRNGIETTAYVTKRFPDIKVIALTMEDNEGTIIKMLKAGAKGYLLKDMSPDVLFEAIQTVYLKGTFYTDMVTQSLMKLKSDEENAKYIINSLKESEKKFIKLACSDLTYKEIADKMMLSHKTVDGYRESVFIKLDVKSRVGLALFAAKNNLI